METFNNKPIKILIADDDIDDIEFFKITLANANPNATINTVENGAKLLKQLFEAKGVEHHPDFIFLDINMPGLNGKECLKEIRQNKNFNNIPVIIFSTSSDRNDIEETYNNGANLFITKPSDLKTQTELLKTILSLNWNEILQAPDKKNFLQFVSTVE